MPIWITMSCGGIRGGAYNDNDAVTIESHLPADAREFVTAFGLTQLGARAAFKVYVVLNMGNEAGSAAMVVARPGEGETRRGGKGARSACGPR
jgi:hypothetical protein